MTYNLSSFCTGEVSSRLEPEAAASLNIYYL